MTAYEIKVPKFTWVVEPALGSWFDRWKVFVYKDDELAVYDNSYFGKERAVAKAKRLADREFQITEEVAKRAVVGTVPSDLPETS